MDIQKFPALVFGLITVFIVVLSRGREWSSVGHLFLVILLGMSVLGFLLSFFPRRA